MAPGIGSLRPLPIPPDFKTPPSAIVSKNAGRRHASQPIQQAALPDGMPDRDERAPRSKVRLASQRFRIGNEGERTRLIAHVQRLHAQTIGRDDQYLLICVPEHAGESAVIFREQPGCRFCVNKIFGIRSIDWDTCEKAEVAMRRQRPAKTPDCPPAKVTLARGQPIMILAIQHRGHASRSVRAEMNREFSCVVRCGHATPPYGVSCTTPLRLGTDAAVPTDLPL